MLRSFAAYSRSVAAGSGKRETGLTIIILVIASLARLPFIWRGFGGHPDEWSVVRSGLDFWLHGAYYPSRGPGYLLDEIVMLKSKIDGNDLPSLFF